MGKMYTCDVRRIVNSSYSFLQFGVEQIEALYTVARLGGL